jgi:hypothetical protein
MTVSCVAFCAVLSVLDCTVDADRPFGVVGKLHVAVLAGVTLGLACALSAGDSQVTQAVIAYSLACIVGVNRTWGKREGDQSYNSKEQHPKGHELGNKATLFEAFDHGFS